MEHGELAYWLECRRRILELFPVDEDADRRVGKFIADQRRAAPFTGWGRPIYTKSEQRYQAVELARWADDGGR